VPLTADEAFSRLRAAHAHGRFAHAYLITGPERAGTRELAIKLTGLILGTNEDPLRHPDAHVLEAESKSRRIKIEPVRELERELHLRSFFGGPKVGVIFDADRLLEAAANAFLKTLEEPPERSHLLLVSSHPEQLPETVLSRCIEVPLRTAEAAPLDPRQMALLGLLESLGTSTDLPGAFFVLQRFNGLLAEARLEIQDEIAAAQKNDEIAYKQVGDVRGLEEREEYYKALVEARYRHQRAALLEVLEQWVADALRQQHGTDGLDYPRSAHQTKVLAATLSTSQLLGRAEALGNLRENLERNVQEQLALECAFLKVFAREETPDSSPSTLRSENRLRKRLVS
jgi:DNA polymerase-3 subunit delta'